MRPTRSCSPWNHKHHHNCSLNLNLNLNLNPNLNLNLNKQLTQIPSPIRFLTHQDCPKSSL
jgi:hypothetical protein